MKIKAIIVPSVRMGCFPVKELSFLKPARSEVAVGVAGEPEVVIPIKEIFRIAVIECQIRVAKGEPPADALGDFLGAGAIFQH
jgi:hypothetical protein